MKNSFLVLISFFVLWISWPQNIWAQSRLDDYVADGLKSNLALAQQDLDIKQSIEALQEARSFFLPNVSFNASYTFADGGRSIDVPVGDLLNPVYQTLNQLTDGNSFPSSLANASESILPHKFHDTRLEISQPLFNSDIYYNYKAKYALVSVQEAKREVYRQELTKEIKKGYYEYLKTIEILAIYDATEVLLSALLKVNKTLVKNHKATKDIVYAAQYEISDLSEKIAEAKRLNQLSKSYFNFLLNRDLNDSIHIDSGFVIANGPLGKVNSFQDQAISQRQELKQILKTQEASQYVLKLHRGTKMPKVSIGGSAGFQGFGYQFDNDQAYSLMQLNFSLPIFTGFRNNAKIQQSKIAIDKLKFQHRELEQQVKVEVVNAYHNLKAMVAKREAKIAAARSAEASFNIIKRKYEEHQIILVEFLDARTKYTNSQIGLSIANYDLLIKQVEFQRILAL